MRVLSLATLVLCMSCVIDKESSGVAGHDNGDDEQFLDEFCGDTRGYNSTDWEYSYIRKLLISPTIDTTSRGYRERGGKGRDEIRDQNLEDILGTVDKDGKFLTLKGSYHSWWNSKTRTLLYFNQRSLNWIRKLQDAGKIRFCDGFENGFPKMHLPSIDSDLVADSNDGRMFYIGLRDSTLTVLSTGKPIDDNFECSDDSSYSCALANVLRFDRDGEYLGLVDVEARSSIPVAYSK